MPLHCVQAGKYTKVLLPVNRCGGFPTHAVPVAVFHVQTQNVEPRLPAPQIRSDNASNTHGTNLMLQTPRPSLSTKSSTIPVSVPTLVSLSTIFPTSTRETSGISSDGSLIGVATGRMTSSSISLVQFRPTPFCSSRTGEASPSWAIPLVATVAVAVAVGRVAEKRVSAALAVYSCLAALPSVR